MKLLFAIKTLTAAGGAERVFCTVVNELVLRGHELTVLTFDAPGTPAFYELSPGLNRFDLGVGNATKPAKVLETLQRIKALRSVICSECPQVAVGFMHAMFVPLAIAAAGTGIPIVGSEHIVPAHYRTRRLEYLLFIFISPLLAKVTVLSAAIQALYPWPIRRRMAVMPNPVSQFDSAIERNPNRPMRVLLTVGRLDPQKDHVTLIQAFACIANTFTDWELRIIGEGPLRPLLEQLVMSLDLRGRVKMPGVTAAIGTEYVNADVFALPSRYEAFGLVTAEAMSYGLPVIGFVDCPGTNELIQAGSTGLLVAAGADRMASMAGGLASLLSDPDLRRQLGDAGKLAIGQSFSTQHVCDLWERLLESACAESWPTA